MPHEVTLTIVNDQQGRWSQLVAELIVFWWNGVPALPTLKVRRLEIAGAGTESLTECPSAMDGIELWVAGDLKDSLMALQKSQPFHRKSLVWFAGDFLIEETLQLSRVGVHGWLSDGVDLLRWRPALQRRFSRHLTLAK